MSESTSFSEKFRITKRNVDALEAGKTRRMHWDENIPGFGVEVMPTGVKVFRLVYRYHGRARQLTLGTFGALTCEQARALANQARGTVAQGGDPAGVKSAARRAATFRDAFEDWFASHVEAKRKPATVAAYRKLADKHLLPTLGARKLVEIERVDISTLHRRLGETPHTANRVVAVARAFFNWAEGQGLRRENGNPARLIEFFRENRRERMLSPEELQRLGTALRAAEIRGEWPWAIAAILLLLFTGARKNEILGLRWAEVDMRAATARLSDSKTGAKTLHFSGAAMAVLRGLEMRRGQPASFKDGRTPPAPRKKSGTPRFDIANNPHVIVGRVQDGALVGVNHVWLRVRRDAGLDDVRIHDLRHAFASVAASSGMSLVTIGRLLGHSQPSVTDRYAHLSATPLLAAANAIGGEIAMHVHGPSSRASLRTRIRRRPLSLPPAGGRNHG